MGLKGRDRDQPSDVESEREALRRQRVEAANELAALKRALSERVAQVQPRERELADALARVEKREQKLDASDGRGSRLDAVRLRLAEAKEGRAALDERRAELDAREQQLAAREAALAAGEGPPPAPIQAPPDPAITQELEAREAALAEAEQELAAREAALEARAAELEAREQEHVAPTAAPEPEPEPQSDELERIEAKLAELREAEQAFVRTRHELAARSDALTEQEAALAERERALIPKETPPQSPDLEVLEARIRRLEQSGHVRHQGGADVRRRPARPPGTRSARQPRAGRASTLRPPRGVSSAGRAPPLQGGGRRFDPGTLHAFSSNVPHE